MATCMCSPPKVERRRMELQRYRVEVLASESEFEHIREFWRSSATFRDADLEFFQFICRLFPEVIRPHVMVVYCNDLPRGLLLGRIEEKPFAVKIGYLKLHTPKLRVITFIHGGIVGHPTDVECAELIDCLRACLRKGDAKVAFLPSVDTAAPIFKYASAAAGYPFRRLFGHAKHFVGTVNLAKTTLIASLSVKERSNFRRGERRLLNAHQGRVHIRHFHAEGEIGRLMDEAEFVASRSYQRGLSVGFVPTTQMRNRLEFEAKQGWLRAYVLYAGDKPCAYWIGSLYKGTLYSDYVGFDPDQKENRPGGYLTVQVLEELCGLNAGTRASSLDFGGGESEWKRVIIGDQGLVEANVCLFAPTLQGQALRLVWAASEAINLGGKTLLNRTGRLHRIKRKWRNLVSQRSHITP
jgi:hypothetical protein